MTVTNHSKALEKALNLDSNSVCHEVNFHFSGKLNGDRISIYTEPVDEEQNEIRIKSIVFEEEN